jgi:hypothetical protein
MVHSFARSLRVPALSAAALCLAAACDSPVAPASNYSTSQGPSALGMSAHAPAAGPLGTQGPVPSAESAAPRVVRAPATGPRFSTGATGTPPMVTILVHDVHDGRSSLLLTSGAQWAGQYGALPQVVTTWSMAAYGDLTGDGTPDIVWQNTQTGERSVWFMTATQWALQYAMLPTVPTEWSIAGAGDFDGDGKADLVWQNTRTGERSIWFMNGARYEGRYALLPQVSVDWRIAAVGDFNADGRPDLVWQNTNGTNSVWFMNGAIWGGSYAMLPSVPAEWHIAAATDFDGDARPDLLWQNVRTGQSSVWFMSGSTWNGAYALLPDMPLNDDIVGAAPAPAGSPPGDITAPMVSVMGVVDGGSYATGPTVTIGASDDTGFGPLPLRVSVRRTVGGASYCATSAQVAGGLLSGADPTPTSAACPTLTLSLLGSGVFAQAGTYTLTAAAVDAAGNVSATQTVGFVVGTP